MFGAQFVVKSAPRRHDVNVKSKQKNEREGNLRWLLLNSKRLVLYLTMRQCS